MEKVLQNSGASRIQVSQDEAERLRFWSGRKNAFPAAGRIAADYYCMDGTIPRRQIATLLKRIKQMEEKYQLGCLNVFHAGDGNMHPLILFNGADPDEWHRAEEFGTDILESCIELGGTITGEHGVGIEKINSMCVQFGESERNLFWGVKASFDPKKLLNPDKAIPTLNRCAEYGRMRISGGKLPHPELERF
jgi:glycolate oxidase